MFKQFKLYFVAIVLLTAWATQGRAGSETRNGGDYLAVQAYDTVRLVIDASRKLLSNNREVTKRYALSADTLDKLESTLHSTEILSKNSVLTTADGSVRDALNFPEKNLILFNSEKWINKNQDPESQVKIILHEVASLAGLESTDNYKATVTIMSLLRENKIDLAKLVGAIDFQKLRENLVGLYRCSYEENKIIENVNLTFSEQGKVEVLYDKWKVITKDFFELRSPKFFSHNLSCAYTPVVEKPGLPTCFDEYSKIKSPETYATKGANGEDICALQRPVEGGVFAMSVISYNQIDLQIQMCRTEYLGTAKLYHLSERRLLSLMGAVWSPTVRNLRCKKL